MAFGKSRRGQVDSPSGEASNTAPNKRKRTHWLRGVVMSLGVAAANLIYFAFTGDSLSSPRYGALTRRGHQSNPGGAISLTIAMLIFAAFCYWMHRRQLRKEQGSKKQP